MAVLQILNVLIFDLPEWAILSFIVLYIIRALIVHIFKLTSQHKVVALVEWSVMAALIIAVVSFALMVIVTVFGLVLAFFS